MRLLRRFARAKDGGVAPLLAIAAVPLFSVVGAAIDFGRAASARMDMQSALDASAIMLVKDSKNVDQPQLAATAAQYFNANFQNLEIQNLDVLASSSSLSSGYTVQMTATATLKTRFMGIVGIESMNLAVRSAANSSADGLGCVLSLNAHATGSVAGQGSTVVKLEGCSLYDNSDSSSALAVGGSAQISAYSVGVVGNVSGASNIAAAQGIWTGIGAVTDPYTDKSYPPVGDCTHNNYTAKDTVTLSPGVYCGGIGLNAGADVTLSPGIYYLDGGSLSVNGGAILSGDGVTLVFTSKNRNGFATATINGNATVNLKPPTTGSTSGIVIFGDRTMPEGEVFKFNGGATQYLGGAIYIPRGTVNFSGGMGTSTDCTQLIADTVTFTGNSGFALNCKNYAIRPFSPRVLKLTM